jgi:uncharacterized protein YjbJ (UPF0337 family)
MTAPRRSLQGAVSTLLNKEFEMKERVRGKAEEIKGKVTGDKGLQAKGKARQKVGEVKEAAKSIAYDLRHKDKKR